MLQEDRQITSGGGVTRITYSAISSYARDHRISGTAFALFLAIIRGMDSEFVTWVREQFPKGDGSDGRRND